MNPMAKLLIFGGIILLVTGLLWQVVGKHLPLGRLPGDIAIEKEGFRFYFPIVTCLVISVIVSLVMLLIRFLSR